MYNITKMNQRKKILFWILIGVDKTVYKKYPELLGLVNHMLVNY